MTSASRSKGEDVAGIAAGLTPMQRRALNCLPVWGLPLGHNQWFDLSYFTTAEPERLICNGEDMEHCVRLGLVDVGEREDEAGEHLVEDDRDVEARWRLHITGLGVAVHAHLTDQEGQNR